MEHILKKTVEELHTTHEEVENYKIHSLKECFLYLFGKSFKKIFFRYAHKKEEILVEYYSLYDHFLKDINNSKAKASDIQIVQKSLEKITEDIRICGELLEKIIQNAESERQESLLSHEKKFFYMLLESFHGDLISWTQKHEQEIFGDISKIESTEEMSPLITGKALLEAQKKRLASHMEHISKN